MIIKKPKSMWLMNFSALAAIIFSVIGLLLYFFLENRILGAIFTVLIISCWFVGITSFIFYFFRQISGAYNNVQPRTFKNQIW